MNKVDYFSFNWLADKINNKSILDNLSYIKGKVIDLGCGKAPYKEDILMVADVYIGVDWEHSFHDNLNVDVFANLCAPLPFADDFADTIVSFQVMEHLPDPLFFISECKRILKSEGCLLLTVPFMWHIHEEPHDYYRYTRYGLEYLLKKNGFVDINIKENTGFWQMWVLKFNYHTFRFSKGLLKYFWIPIWWFGQHLSKILDDFIQHPQETASYTVLARKP